MYFNAPLPRGGIGILHEASNMQSPRSSDAVGNAWKNANLNSGQLDGIVKVQSRQQREINRLRRRVPTLIQPVTTMHPFKIYQPSLSSLPPTGLIFNAGGVPSTIAINVNAPTNLPTTVNPSTDWWRFWAVRNGVFEQRGLFHASSGNNYADEVDVYNSCAVMAPSLSGTDGVSPYNIPKLSYDYQTTDIQWRIGDIPNYGNVLIMDNAAGNGAFYIWLQITLDTETEGLIYGQIRGSSSGFPSDSCLVIPVGIIPAAYTVPIPGSIQPQQFLFDNIVNRYAPGLYQNPSVSPAFWGALSWAGAWTADELSGTAFYNGDVILDDTTKYAIQNSSSTYYKLWIYAGGANVVSQPPSTTPAGWKYYNSQVLT